LIVIAGRVRLQPGTRDEALALCLANAAASRAEAGCLGYRFYTDPEDAGVLFVFEEWQDEDALQAHFRAPHLQDFMARIPHFAAEPVRVTRYVVSESGPL
jgi:quinol monooxygenase YgiN